jgi:FeS assembly SUF system regulator
MRLSRLADYAIVLLTHIAQHPEAVHTGAEAALATGVPQPTTARILARLCRSGVLTSTRGAKGGYVLGQPAADISVGDVVSVFDGPVNLTRCVSAARRPCEVETTCPSRAGLNRINVAVRKALNDVSLADLAVVGGVPPHRMNLATTASTPEMRR